MSKNATPCYQLILISIFTFIVYNTFKQSLIRSDESDESDESDKSEGFRKKYHIGRCNWLCRRKRRMDARIRARKSSSASQINNRHLNSLTGLVHNVKNRINNVNARIDRLHRDDNDSTISQSLRHIDQKATNALNQSTAANTTATRISNELDGAQFAEQQGTEIG